MFRSSRESETQAAIVAFVEAVLPRAMIWAVPNAARRSQTGRATNAVPGLRKGVFDLSMILPDGRFCAIEVKADRGSLSPEQVEFKGALMARGVPHCIARDIEDVRFFLARLGVSTREVPHGGPRHVLGNMDPASAKPSSENSATLTTREAQS